MAHKTEGLDMTHQKKLSLPRDFHKLQIIKREAKGYTSAVPSKKYYQRKKENASWRKELGR